MTILKTILATLFGVAVAAFCFLAMGGFDVAADTPHSAFTLAVIDFTRSRSIETRMAGLVAPDLQGADRIALGARHYGEMCASCHGTPDSEGGELVEGMYPQPPDLFKEPIDDVVESFWTIKHGIKSTGMPAWGASHDDDKIWSMVAFLDVLPKLTKEQYDVMTAGGDGDDDAAAPGAAPTAEAPAVGTPTPTDAPVASPAPPAGAPAP